MKIIVPMAGRGSRLVGFQGSVPKPFVQVAGQPMLAWALRSISKLEYDKIIFIALAEHETTYGLRKWLTHALGARHELLLLDDVTEGQLCTVLTARDLINDDEDVLIASADTYVVSALENDIAHRAVECHGIISVADLPGDRWSFARTDAAGQVVEVTEKVRISNHASTGLYYFSHGCELVQIGQEMIRNGEKTRGEYYVIPVYQKFIQRGWRVNISIADEMWDMGTPEALARFEEYHTPRR
ncbi:hypothetical protein FBQ82_00995 [Anaerolineae bacterium CFX7]|nr:hypothetical protein [Anaerolineae bacterium CFX7]